MIRLEKYNDRFFYILNAYKLDETQTSFTASIDYCINERKDLIDPFKSIISIMYNNIPVGFFVLDSGADKHALTDQFSSILLRSFSINPQYQGKGIGSKAMTLASEYMNENMPEIKEIVLSVNCNNSTAYHLYLKCGYIDHGKMIAGRKGPQNVLTKML